MAYEDTVLAKNPVAYFTLSGSAGNTDLTGNGHTVTSYSAGTDTPIVPGYLPCSPSSWAISNPRGFLTSVGIGQNQTIELWARFKVDPFSGNKTSSYSIMQNSDASNKIYIENSLIIFQFTANGTTYYSFVDFADWDEILHVAGVVTPSGFFVYANGVAGTVQPLPDNYTVSVGAGSMTLAANANVLASHLALYDRSLGLEELNQNFESGRKSVDRSSVVTATGGNFYNLSKSNSNILFRQRADSSNFIVGDFRNVTLSGDRVSCIDYPPAIVRDTTGATITPAYSSGITIGNNSHVMIPARPAVSPTTGAVGIRIPVATLTARPILTIYTPSQKKALHWRLNASSVLLLDAVLYNEDGSVASTTTYTYATSVSTNATQNMWFLFDENGVRVSAWSLATNTFNQVSGQNYVAETVFIDSTSEIIVGASATYVGGGTAYGLLKAWTCTALPTSWAGVFSDLESGANNSCQYDFSTSADMTAKTRGEWTLTMDAGADGAFSGSHLDYDISPDSLSGLAVKYNGGSYVTATQGMICPAIPYSGTFPTNPSGPITVQATLATNNVSKNLPSFSYIDLAIYADNKLGGIESIGDITVTGSLAHIRPSNYSFGSGRERLNCTFGTSTYLSLPADATNQAHRSVEFVFSTTGSVTSGSVILSSRNTGNTATNQLLISSALLVTVSGPDWPNSAVYLNGVAIGAGATAKTDSPNHVLIVGTAATNAALFLNANIDGSLVVSGASTRSSYGYIGSWPVALTASQITALLAARLGIIRAGALPTVTDTIPVTETALTRVNVTPWQSLVG